MTQIIPNTWRAFLNNGKPHLMYDIADNHFMEVFSHQPGKWVFLTWVPGGSSDADDYYCGNVKEFDSFEDAVRAMLEDTGD